MTEEEAKQRWCPFARLGNEPGCNRWPTDHERTEDEGSFARCIASACMAWRWSGYRAKDGSWIRKTATGPWDPTNADGFCGLAGAQL